MTDTKTPAKPYRLADQLGGEGTCNGYTLNIHEDKGQRFAKDGPRICQIPAFTWRSREAVIALGHQLRAVPVLIEALEGAIGALEFSREFHNDLGNEEQAFAQDKLDRAQKALAIARGEDVI